MRNQLYPFETPVKGVFSQLLPSMVKPSLCSPCHYNMPISFSVPPVSAVPISPVRFQTGSSLPRLSQLRDRRKPRAPATSSPLGQQPHACRAQDVKRSFLVLLSWDVGCRELKQRAQVGRSLLRGCRCHGDACPRKCGCEPASLTTGSSRTGSVCGDIEARSRDR